MSITGIITLYADDQDPPTCFVANNPLCSVCEESLFVRYTPALSYITKGDANLENVL